MTNKGRKRNRHPPAVGKPRKGAIGDSDERGERWSEGRDTDRPSVVHEANIGGPHTPRRPQGGLSMRALRVSRDGQAGFCHPPRSLHARDQQKHPQHARSPLSFVDPPPSPSTTYERGRVLWRLNKCNVCMCVYRVCTRPGHGDPGRWRRHHHRAPAGSLSNNPYLLESTNGMDAQKAKGMIYLLI